MKTFRSLFATLFLLCIAGMATAQDVIVMKDQSTVMTKVLEITSTEIKYKKWNNQDGPTYSVLRSEVASINYENGEVERFLDNPISQQNNYQEDFRQTIKGYMDIEGVTLKVNGHKLSDEEVRRLVGEQDYQLYLSGKRQSNVGDVFLIVSGVVLGGGLGALLGSISKRDTDLLTFSLITTMSGVVISIPGWALSTVGSNKLKQVAENYNLNRGLYSFNISPSLMKCEIPQGNCGLGLTVSMNF